MAVVGLGLIGGSIARALTRAGYRLVGVDGERQRRRARAAGAVAVTRARLESAAALADVVVLAAPPRANLVLLGRLAAVDRPGLVITDVGSVKGPICREAQRLGLRQFVGGHPMAGSERSGFAASSPDLFRAHPWILTPVRRSGNALRVVRGFVQAVGGRPVVLAADEHDRMAAFLSHAPQVVSWAVAAAARADPVARQGVALAGPAFQGITRLARSPRALWTEILSQNRREVARAMAAIRRRLRAP